MIERHEVLSSGMKVDRPWWLGTKLAAAMVVTVVTAYFVAMALLGKL